MHPCGRLTAFLISVELYCGDLSLTVPRITVVGSYATGLTMRVDRLPNRGETLLGTDYRVDYGGKGSNQAVGCARLGAQVSFIASIGQDSFGSMAEKLYREEGIGLEFIKRMPDCPTGVGFIIVDSAGHNCITIDPGANELLTAAAVRESSAAFNQVSVVMTQLEISVEAAEAALTLGRELGAVTILNPAPVRPLPASVLQLVDVLTPNETEAKVLAGRSPEFHIDPETVARELLAYGVKQVVMTLGEKGALIVTGSSTTHVPAHILSAIDTTGAGDAFNAGLAVALAFGAPLEPAVRFAVVTGGLAVTREGVIPSLPSLDEVLEFFKKQKISPPEWLLHSRRQPQGRS
jgi:ribokinase